MKKKRIGTIKGKPIIEGGDTNILTNNEILVQNNKIIVRENEGLIEIGNNESNNNNSTDNLVENFVWADYGWDPSYTYQVWRTSSSITSFFKKDESTGIWTFDYKNVDYSTNNFYISGFISDKSSLENILYVSERGYSNSSDVESSAITILNNKYIYLKPVIWREDTPYSFFPSSTNQLIPIKLV